MSVIHKYQFTNGPFLTIPLDPGAIVRHVDMQGGLITLWIEKLKPQDDFDPARMFRIFGTGHEIPPDYKYVGSCIDGSFVWHVYERTSS